MNYILHLETATKVCSVALSENGVLKQLREVQEEGFSHGENLTVFIEEVLDREGISAKNLNAISLTTGPGSYTGLRIGVSVAKGLCYALDIPLIGLDALSCLAEEAKKKYPGQTIIPMLDARRLEVYCSVYSASGEEIEPIHAQVLDENSFSEYQSAVFCGDGVEKMIPVWATRDLILDKMLLSSAAHQVGLAYESYLAKKFEDLAYIEPLYLKEFGSK